MIINETETNEAMRQALAKAVRTGTVMQLLSCEAAAEEFMLAVRVQAETVGEDDLDAVSGGEN